MEKKLSILPYLAFYLGLKFWVGQHMMFQGYVIATSGSRAEYKFCKGRWKSQSVNAPKML